MKQKILSVIATLAALTSVPQAAAQYYTWGSDPASLRWQSMRTPQVQVIYPDTAAAAARRTLFYIEAARPSIGYGFRHGPLRIPFVVHPVNFQSNGLVMWLPKRVEFLTTPSVDGYAMPWLKQLVAHEYRHAVQYNNLNRGVIRVASWLLGQQGSTVGLLFMPLWALEGDAVMSETEMSSYGRGRQPRFTLEYRAMGDFARSRRNPDKWFCGSYLDPVPDHYQLGYQLCSWAYTRYGENVWDKTARYGVRNPYVFFTNTVALRKYYGTDVKGLFRDTFDDLYRYWSSLPQAADTSRPLTPMPERNYTTYRWPLPLGDTAVLALRTDYDRPMRFVRIDRRTGAEQRVGYTGQVSSRPAMGYGRVWWTEYRRSLLFAERVNSQLCCMELAGGRPRTVAGKRNVLYPAVVSESSLAWVEYVPDGSYTIVRRDGEAERRTPQPPGREIHGLAWDDATAALYVLVTDDSGMWLGRVREGVGLHPLTEGAYITLSDLRAGDGKLYFGSIASGRDEVHCFDLAAGCEYRITTSTYGSFAPAPAGADVLMTTYGPCGWHVAVQAADSVLTAVAPARLPVDLVNPPRRRWEVVNLDTVRFASADSAALQAAYPARRYRRLPTLVKVHSWAPVAFDPFRLADEHDATVNIGTTVLSQNLLSNAEGFVSYGWNDREGSLVRGAFRYFGLGVHLAAEGSYGGDRIVYSLMQADPETGGVRRQPQPPAARYWSVGASAVLPLYFQRGYHTRQLSLSAGWNYSNGEVADLNAVRFDAESGAITNLDAIGYRSGLHKVSVGVGFSDAVRAAHRDFVSPWGYSVSASYSFNPTNRQFSDLMSFYGRVYTPGFFAHHSLSVAAAYQTSVGGCKSPSGQPFLMYSSARLLPRGLSASDILNNNYTAASVDYQFPVWYPEGGIPGVVYFKRIRLNLGGDFAQYRYRSGSRGHWQRLWSYGADVIFDLNVLRMPAAATSTVKVSVYKPTGRNVWFSLALGLPF